MAKSTVLENLIIRLMGDSTQYQKVLTDAAAKTKEATRQIQEQGLSMTKKLTLPVAAVGTLGVMEFAKFDQAMTEAFAKMGVQAPAVTKQMEDMAKGLAMSGEVRFSPAELAKGYEELASAGLDAEQSMAALPMVSKLAQAGAFDVGVAVKQVTGAMASFGAMSKDPAVFGANLEKFSDVIVGVANETTTGVEEVARAMAADAAVAAKGYGMELETLGAILGVYAQQNKDAEEAGNLTGRAVRLMTASFVKNRADWKAMGVDIADAEGNFIKFPDAIAKLETALTGLSDVERIKALDKLGFETLAQKSILPLIGMSDELKRQEAIYRKNGTTAEMARIQMMSWSNQMAVFRNHLSVVAIELGKVLAPMVSRLTEILKQGLIWWRGLSDGTKQFIINAALIAAAIGPLLTGFSLLGTAIQKMALMGIGPLAGLKNMLLLVTQAMRIMGAAATLALGPWGVVILLVVGLIALIVSELGGLEATWELIKSAGVSAWEFIKRSAIEFWEFIKPVLRAVGELILAAFGRLRSAFQAVWTWLKAQWEDVKAVWGTIMSFIGLESSTTFTKIRDRLIDFIKSAQFVLENLGTIFKLLFVTAAYRATKFINEMVHSFTVTLPEVFMYLLKNWKAIVLGMFDYAKAVFERLVENVFDLITSIPDLITGAKSFADVWKGFADIPPPVIPPPVLTPRAEGEVERTLRELMEETGRTLENAWREFWNRGAGVFGDEGGGGSFDEAISAAGAAGTEVGKAIGGAASDAAKNEMGNLESTLFRSSEALSRVIAFREMTGMNRPKANGMPNPFTDRPKPMRPRWTDGGGDFDSGESTGLLAEIRDILEELSDILVPAAPAGI